MIHQELLFYVKEQQKRGVPNAEIKEVLMREGGWVEADIDEVFRFIVVPIQSQSSVTQSSSAATSQPAQAPVQVKETVQPATMPSSTQASSVTSSPSTSSKSVAMAPATSLGTAETAAAKPAQPMLSPEPLSPYAPTKGGATPAFSGMETRVMLEKAKPAHSSHRKAGIIAGILVLAILVGGGAYAFATYVRPKPDAALAHAGVAFAKAASFRFAGEATAENLSPSLFSFIPGEATSSETGETSILDTTSKFTLSGSVARDSANPKYSVTGALMTPSLPVTVSVQAKTAEEGVLFKFQNLGYFIERFGLPNETQPETWYVATSADVSGSIAPQLSLIKALAPMVTPSQGTSTAIASLLRKHQIIVPTTILPRGTDGGKTYLRYQFTVSKDGIRELALDLIQNGQGAPATPEQIAEIDRTLEGLTFSDGELWISPFTFLPHRISFRITGASGSEIPFTNLAVSLTLSGYNDAFPTEINPTPVSIRDFIEGAKFKQKDTRVESLLSQSRVQAEMFYGNRRTYRNLCTASSELATTFAELKTITGQDPVCFSDSKAYAIATPVPSDGAQIACVDSKGTNGRVASLPTKAVCE